MIPRPVAGVGGGAALPGQQFDAALQAVAGRSDQAVFRELGLSMDQWHEAARWLGGLRAAAGRRDRISGYWSGDPRFGLDGAALRQLIEAALGCLARWQALELLEDSNDTALTALFSDVRLLERLQSAIPAGHPLRGELDGFLTRRLDNGQVIPQVLPDRPFRPGLIGPALGGLGVGDDVTPDQLRLAGEALARLGRVG